MVLQSSSSPLTWWGAGLQADVLQSPVASSVNLAGDGLNTLHIPDASQEYSTVHDKELMQPRPSRVFYMLTQKLRPLEDCNSKDQLFSASQITLPSHNDDGFLVPGRPVHRKPLPGCHSPRPTVPVQRDKTNQLPLSDKHFEAIPYESIKKSQQSESCNATEQNQWKDLENRTQAETVHHRATWRYKTEDKAQLSFEENEVFTICTKLADGWWFGRRLTNGESGWIPSPYFDPRPTSSLVVVTPPRRQRAIRQKKCVKRPATCAKIEVDHDEPLQLYRQASQMLLMTRECAVCGDSKPCADFPEPSRLQCDHKWETCRDCVRRWIAAELDGKGWEHINCPEPDCTASLNHPDVSQLADAVTFQRYDALATRAHLSTLPNFRWCLSPSCQSGQIHDTDSAGPIFTCAGCGLQFCMQHEAPWHRGETCQQVDRRVRGEQRGREERATEKMLAQTTKRCPGKSCGWLIEKNKGCDHMTCRQCKHEFCWLCLAPYDPIRRHGNARHRTGCKYHSDILR